MSDVAPPKTRKAPQIRTTVYAAMLKLFDEYGLTYYDDDESFKLFYRHYFVPCVLEPTEEAK